MSERDRAEALARQVLDDVGRDPDSDLSMLARQFLRAVGRERLRRGDLPAHQPGDAHHYRIECEVCGERGMIRLTVDPERAP